MYICMRRKTLFKAVNEPRVGWREKSPNVTTAELVLLNWYCIRSIPVAAMGDTDISAIIRYHGTLQKFVYHSVRCNSSSWAGEKKTNHNVHTAVSHHAYSAQQRIYIYVKYFSTYNNNSSNGGIDVLIEWMLSRREASRERSFASREHWLVCSLSSFPLLLFYLMWVSGDVYGWSSWRKLHNIMLHLLLSAGTPT